MRGFDRLSAVDAGRRPALLSRAICAVGGASFHSREIGGGRRCRCWFRAPARCRSETGAPRPRDSARLAMRGFAAVRLAGGGVVGAGFALPRDAGRRPALHREIGGASVVGAGFALPRDAGRRPALHREIGGASVVGAGFALPRDAGRRPALHREIGGASVVGAGFALPRDAGRRPALHPVRLAGPALSVRVSRSRAMPVGDRRSTP